MTERRDEETTRKDRTTCKKEGGRLERKREGKGIIISVQPHTLFACTTPYIISGQLPPWSDPELYASYVDIDCF